MSVFKSLALYGSTSPPPVAPKIPDEVYDCPPVSVTDGGAAVRVGGGEGAAVRSQLSIAHVARECRNGPDGSMVVKVGVQGRALLGQGATGGAHFDSPLTIVLRRGDQILASRTRRVSVTVPAGETDAPFVVVEEGLVAPAGTGEFDIEVGFGTAAAGSEAAAKPRRRARRS